jgi:hypothetical protein
MNLFVNREVGGDSLLVVVDSPVFVSQKVDLGRIR